MAVNPRHVLHVVDELKGFDGLVEPRHIHAVGAAESGRLLALYQRYLEERLGAFQVMWMAAYRGPFGREFWQTELMDGWKVVDIATPLDSPLDHDLEKQLYFEAARQHGMDPTAAHTIRNTGQTRVHLLEECLGGEAWDGHWMQERLAAQGTADRVIGAYNLGLEAESIFLVDRPPGTAPFSPEDAATLLRALVEFPRLHYWLMLERGLVEPSKRPFTPREREIIRLLLGSLQEKEIAETLDLKPTSAHQYIGEIYRTLGVSSRYELVQLWLRAVPESALSAN